jgi:uncharacterized membrane protein
VEAALKFLYLTALIVWLGEVVFFSFVAAPMAFRSLSTQEAGRVVGAIFPLYYALGTIAGAVALSVGFLLRLQAQEERGKWLLAMVLLLIMLGANLYAWQVILPRTQVLRSEMQDAATNPPPTVAAEFRSLHARAMLLNLVVLLAGVGVVVVAAVTLRL